MSHSSCVVRYLACFMGQSSGVTRHLWCVILSCVVCLMKWRIGIISMDAWRTSHRLILIDKYLSSYILCESMLLYFVVYVLDACIPQPPYQFYFISRYIFDGATHILTDPWSIWNVSSDLIRLEIEPDKRWPCTGHSMDNIISWTLTPFIPILLSLSSLYWTDPLELWFGLFVIHYSFHILHPRSVHLLNSF